jgi:uncharacterized protein YndB with AHSA1/START domain
MPSAERTVSIRRPVDQVFRFLADGRTATQWRLAVVEISKISGSGVGEAWRQVVRGPGGRPVAADYELTALEPEQRIAFRTIAGPVRPEGEYQLEAMGDATILTFRLWAELTGWKRLVLGRAVQASMDTEMRALDLLQEVLER